MKSIQPQQPHHINIHDVRRMYGERTGNPTVGRQTVNEWLKRRGVTAHGPNSKQRIFDRAAVICAMDSDFPSEPRFITVEDAFLMAGLSYPNSRNKISE